MIVRLFGRLVFMADAPAPPAAPGVPAPPAAPGVPAVVETGGSPGANDPDEAKFRRLFEKRDGEYKDLKKTLDGLMKEREDAKVAAAAALAAEAEAKKSAEQKTADRLKALEDELATSKHEGLRLKIAGEFKISGDALEFLTGSDEAGLRAQAEKLSKLLPSGDGAQGGGQGPVRAGTTTRPAGTQAPAISEQLAAAQKSGNLGEVIRLKRAQIGLGIPPES